MILSFEVFFNWEQNNIEQIQRNRSEFKKISLLICFTKMQLQAGKSSRKRPKMHDNIACIFCRFPCDMYGTGFK